MIKPITRSRFHISLILATDANCTSQVLYDIDSGTHTCLCGVGCLDRHYEKQLSVATWPSKQYLVIKSNNT